MVAGGEVGVKRRYTLRQRAQSQDQTRRRIVEAAFRLHSEIGPAATTLTAIAKLAGVQRLTVYRHFPDEPALFQACSTHSSALNPAPSPAAWKGSDAPALLCSILSDFYRYYRGNPKLIAHLERDVNRMEVLQPLFSPFLRRREEAAGTAAASYGARGPAEARLRAVIRHALAFETWRGLTVEGGLDDDSVIELMLDLAALAAGGGTRRTRRTKA